MKDRIYIKDLFDMQENEDVLLRGWVHNSKDLKKIRFIILKDKSGRVQVTGVNGKTDAELFSLMDNLKRESAVEVRGKIKNTDMAPGGKEILPTEIKIIADAKDPLPIDVSDYSKTELPKKLDWRFVDLHSQRTQAIFKIQSTIMQAFRAFMIKEGAIEAVFPSLIGSSSEGGTEVYKLKHFEKEAFLSQSCQLYKQMVACSMEKVFTIFTVWRAEKHNTNRHLNEARQLDYEECFVDDKDVMGVLSKSVRYIISKVKEERAEELDILGVKDLKLPESKYLTFAEVKEIMIKEGVEMEKYDLSSAAEKKLGELYGNDIVFVHDWPIKGKPFYIMPKGDGLSGGFDAIWRGMEITSGGQRIHIPELLIERLKANDLNPEDFEGYIDSFRFGAPPHGGFGMGLERLTMLMLNIENIRDVTMFPRDRHRLTP